MIARDVLKANEEVILDLGEGLITKSSIAPDLAENVLFISQPSPKEWLKKLQSITGEVSEFGELEEFTNFIDHKNHRGQYKDYKFKKELSFFLITESSDFVVRFENGSFVSNDAPDFKEDLSLLICHYGYPTEVVSK